MTDENHPYEDMEPPPLLDDQGREIPDPKPLRIPLGFKRPETLAEQVQRLVRNGLSIAAEARGAETWEEADDFDIDDDPPDPYSPFEAVFDPLLERDVTAAELVTMKDHLIHQYELAIARRQKTENRAPPSPSKEGPNKGAVSDDLGGGTE